MDGFFDGDADIEQAQFEAEGRSHDRRQRKALAAWKAGDKEKAASLCPHSWRQGRPGSDLLDPATCLDCGSEVQGWGEDTYLIKACAVAPDPRGLFGEGK